MNVRTGAYAMEFDDSGMPAHGEPLVSFDQSESSPHQQVHMEHYMAKGTGGRMHLIVVPQQGMDSKNTVMKRSPHDKQTMVLVHDKGKRALPNEVRKALTKGTHQIKQGNKVKNARLQLDPADETVVKVTDKLSQIHGQGASNMKTSCIYQVFKFHDDVKAKLSGHSATNGVTFLDKFDLVPREESVGGIQFMVFRIGIKENDRHELNFSDEDSDEPSPL